jgi:hypothetical protein
VALLARGERFAAEAAGISLPFLGTGVFKRIPAHGSKMHELEIPVAGLYRSQVRRPRSVHLVLGFDLGSP